MVSICQMLTLHRTFIAGFINFGPTCTLVLGLSLLALLADKGFALVLLET